MDLIEAYCTGQINAKEAAEKFLEARRTYDLSMETLEGDDDRPQYPVSWVNVTLAYAKGEMTYEQMDALHQAITKALG